MKKLIVYTVLSLLTFVFNVNANSLDSGVIAHYTLDNAKMPKPHFGSGNAAYFNPTLAPSEIIDKNKNHLLTDSGSITFMINVDSITTDASVFLCGKSDDDYNYKLVIKQGNRPWSFTMSLLLMSKNKLQTIEIASTTYTEKDNWHDIAIVFNKHQVSFYVNSELQGAKSIADFELNDAKPEIILGNVEVKHGRGFSGQIDDIRYYNRCLSELELVYSRFRIIATIGINIKTECRESTYERAGDCYILTVSTDTATSGNYFLIELYDPLVSEDMIQVIVYDEKGRKLMRHRMSEPQNILIPAEITKTGLYYIKVESRRSETRKQIILQD